MSAMETRVKFPAVIATNRYSLYFNATAAHHITSPHISVKETVDMVVFLPSNISADYKASRKKSGGIEVFASALFEERVVQPGEIYRLYRTQSGALAIKKRHPLINEEGTWKES